MLASSSSIVVTPENLFIMNMYSKYKNTIFDTVVSKQNFINDLWLEKRVNNWGIDKTGLLKYLNNLGELSYSEICYEVYNYYALKNSSDVDSVKYLFDKNPGYSVLAKSLISMYPSAKFIHIVRNPKDNVLSYKNVPFEPNNIIVLAYRWRFYNKFIESCKKLFPDKFITVRYEDLVAEPESTLRSICGFLSLPFEDEMLDFYKNENTNSSQYWHKNLTSTVSSKSVNKWQSGLDETEINSIEKICKELMLYYGYEINLNSKIDINLFNYIYLLFGFLLSVFEIFLFKLPFNLRVYIIEAYRKFNS